MAVELITESTTNELRVGNMWSPGGSGEGKTLAGEMAQCAKGLLHKHENLNSDLQHSCDS